MSMEDWLRGLQVLDLIVCLYSNYCDYARVLVYEPRKNDI